MAYFLKKCSKNGKRYLSIVNSFYDGERGHTVHETYASYGTGSSLIAEGISDPVKYLEDKVAQLNFEKNQLKAAEISDTAPFKYAGHFLIKAVLDKLEIKPIIDVYKMTTNYQFDLYDVLTSLIYSRCLKPCSKYKTYFEVIPYLEKKYSFSYDQLLEGLSYFGDNYERIVEIFTKQIKEIYGVDMNTAYFDCTNFYFEIDREDDVRRKGPSKENRKEPLLAMGLLLDANQIPVGLKLFPGNESEKPKIREIINELKIQNDVKGKIIQVADKGLNCARNIYEARVNGDGYLFSKSCKTLPEVEKKWIFLNNDYVDVKDSNGTVLYRVKECIDEFPYSFEDDNGKKVTYKVKEKRVVTYNPVLAKKQLFEIQKLENKAHELCLSKAKKEEYGECSKYVDFKGKDGSKARTEINQKKIDEDKKLCGFNLLVTSESSMKKEEIYKTYHNLWRIEESFRIMKSDLDARPVYLQLENTIKGHFLICYLTVLLQRIFQFKVLENKYSSSELNEFYKGFQLVEGEDSYTNISIGTDFITELSDMTGLPLDNYFLSPTKLKKVLNYRF